MNHIKKSNWFANEMETHKTSIEFKQEYLLLNITEQILNIMEQQNIRHKDLAEKLGYSDAYVGRLLNGDVDITLNILTRIANVLDYHVDISFNNIKGTL